MLFYEYIKHVVLKACMPQRLVARLLLRVALMSLLLMPQLAEVAPQI